MSSTYFEMSNGLFTLPESDSGSDSNSDFKRNGYIVLREVFTLTGIGSESESIPEFVSRNVNEPELVNEKRVLRVK